MMITKFNIFEKMNLDDIIINITNINENLINILIDKLSIIKKKKKKRSLRPVTITGHFDKKIGTGDYSYSETRLVIHLSNNDFIEGIFASNTIKIYINEIIQYNLNNDEFTNEILIDKIIESYKNFLKSKNWKVNEIFKIIRGK